MNKLNRVLLGAGAFLVMSGGLLALTGWATGADTEAMREVSFFGSSGRRTEAGCGAASTMRNTPTPWRSWTVSSGRRASAG